jgi:L-rhamnose isomerase
MSQRAALESRYASAKQQYADFGVDTERALARLAEIPLSINCWQGDDVVGFEVRDAGLSLGGVQPTGAYPGRARTIDELRNDLHKASTLIPGRKRVNLHAMYGDFGGKVVDRDVMRPEHFTSWMDWAKSHGFSLDFNSTCFSHPLSESGFTLSSDKRDVREFWVEHVQRAREIAAAMGRHQGNACIHDIWLPDGAKDLTMRRALHRKYLKESLDSIFKVAFDSNVMKDAVESKLFGLGSESYVVGSHEFYLGYAFTRNVMLCLDMGHFHPTEIVADKISSILQFSNELLLHVSRGVRWDSDHVVIVNDDLSNLMAEIVRADALARVHFALDYFDASINRIGAWVIGARATLKALLTALLEPVDRLREAEAHGNLFTRLALLEEQKSLPAGAVWDYFCATQDVPVGEAWITEVQRYENDVLRGRV